MASKFYKNLEFSKWNPPATPEQIREAEHKLGANLPQEYRDFLLNTNGGIIRTEPKFVSSDHRNMPMEYALESLLGVAPSETGTISRQLTAYQFDERVPDGIVPIGILATSYRICISLRNEDYGHIYMWGPRHLSPGDEEVPNRKTMKDLFAVANRFTEFLDMLKM